MGFNFKNIRKSVRVKLVISFALALVSLALVSYLSYGSLSGLIDVIKEEAVPDKQLILIRGIQSDLADAESSVRTYTITKNDKYLNPYYYSVTSISDKLDSLRGAYDNKRAALQIVDSIDGLISKKYEVMDQLIQADDGRNVDEIINRVSSQIRKVDAKRDGSGKDNKADKGQPQSETTDSDSVDKEEDEEKDGFLGGLFSGGSDDEAKKEDSGKSDNDDKGLLGGLFGGNDEKKDSAESGKEDKKKEDQEKEVAGDKQSSSVEKMREHQIARAISSIKKQEQRKQQKKEHRELVLTTMDQQIMAGLRKLFGVLEEKAIESSTTKAKEAASSATITKNIITGLAIVAFLLLLILMYVIISDVSKNARYRKILRIAKDRALKLASVKEDFLANISHEIRTPMNAIVGYTQLLNETKLNKTQQEYLKTIDNSSRHLNAIVNDVLDYSKMESGNLNFEEIGYKPKTVFDEVYDSLREGAESKGLLFKVEVDESVPDILIGDPIRLKQILYNIIGNAIKFTEAGEVRIDCFAKYSGEEKVMLNFKVKDTGIGISKEKIDSIFRDFHQEDTSTTRQFGGTGLGLTITRKLIKLQKGKIKVDSEKGKGSTFTVEIPYMVGDKEDLPVQKKEHYTYRSLKGKKILMADDDKYNRTLIKNIMDKWEVDLILVEDGEKAVELAKKVEFDVYLIDVHMPKLNGLEVTKVLRKELNIDKPILALTAAASKKDTQRCLAAGMDASIKKPFRIDDLYASLLKYLGISEKPNEPQEGQNGKKVEEGKNGFNLSELKTIAGGDKEFIKKMLNLFIESGEMSCHRMKTALKSEDWNTIRKTAHKLSPSARQLGMGHLADDLKDIELRIKKEQISDELYPKVKSTCEELDEIIPELKNEVTNLKI